MVPVQGTHVLVLLCEKILHICSQTARMSTGSRNRDHRRLLSVDARPFVTAINSDGSANPNEHLNHHQQQLGERLYPKVSKRIVVIFVDSSITFYMYHLLRTELDQSSW